jgi:hypothetical protein
MCTAPAAVMRWCRMATMWIIVLPAIFTTRTATTATTTVRWCLPKADPSRRGDALLSPRRLGRGCVDEAYDWVGNSLRAFLVRTKRPGIQVGASNTACNRPSRR